MRTKLSLLAVAGAMACVATASAQESGFEIGGRVGYGSPLGDAAGGEGDNALSDLVSGQIPLQLDAGYRLNSQLFLGGYFQYGIAFDGLESCDTDGVSCSANNLRLGAQVQYHFQPITTDSAWVGGGIGYEWVNVFIEQGGVDGTLSARGFEFLNVQGGYDFNVADKFRVGPFAALTLAQYATVSMDVDGTTVSNSIDDKALHSWLLLGVKGTFGPL